MNWRLSKTHAETCWRFPDPFYSLQSAQKSAGNADAEQRGQSDILCIELGHFRRTACSRVGYFHRGDAHWQNAGQVALPCGLRVHNQSQTELFGGANPAQTRTGLAPRKA